MTVDEMIQLFKQSNDDYLRFDLVENKASLRSDLHAFILLDTLLPSESDIISASEHDEFWLEPELEELAAVITPEQVLELVRCGVRCSRDGLCMFS